MRQEAHCHLVCDQGPNLLLGVAGTAVPLRKSGVGFIEHLALGFSVVICQARKVATPKPMRKAVISTRLNFVRRPQLSQNVVQRTLLTGLSPARQSGDPSARL